MSRSLCWLLIRSVLLQLRPSRKGGSPSLATICSSSWPDGDLGGDKLVIGPDDPDIHIAHRHKVPDLAFGGGLHGGAPFPADLICHSGGIGAIAGGGTVGNGVPQVAHPLKVFADGGINLQQHPGDGRAGRKAATGR